MPCNKGLDVDCPNAVSASLSLQEGDIGTWVGRNLLRKFVARLGVT
jgi:hypothetical protein